MKNLWYNIKDSMIGFSTIEKEQNKSHAGQSDLYLKNKSNLFLWHMESCVLLERVGNRKADSYVKTNVKMEDYYRIKDVENGETNG